MQNLILSTRDIDSFINDLANEVAQRLHLWGLAGHNGEPHQQEAATDLLTVQQAADLLHLSVPTIYTQVSRGELPVMKRNKRLYFSRMELMEYLKVGRKKTTAEIEAESAAYISKRKKGLDNGK